jgi:hypothetical protein
MKTEIALKLLADIMQWSTEQATKEFAWLALMARLKYDDYRDFLAGMRFLESLVAWLQQFGPAERADAYRFVRHRLVYVSAAERERLVALLFTRHIWPRLAKCAAKTAGVFEWRVLVEPAAKKALERERRSTLFLGLSDGARLDSFRHLNERTICNEQVVVGVQLDAGKWADLLKKLRKDLADKDALFTRVVLVDDFTASGTSFLRKDENGWTGKLKRFTESIYNQSITAPNCELQVHHLMGTPKAEAYLKENGTAFLSDKNDRSDWIGNIEFTFSHLLAEDVALRADRDIDAAFYALTQKYYNDSLETEHTLKGGVKHLGLGYAGCALPVVLDHNTPNNSVALLWAQTDGSADRIAMRPLFRRRQRHV